MKWRNNLTRKRPKENVILAINAITTFNVRPIKCLDFDFKLLNLLRNAVSKISFVLDDEKFNYKST